MSSLAPLRTTGPPSSTSTFVSSPLLSLNSIILTLSLFLFVQIQPTFCILPCYDNSGVAVFCEPEFANIAQQFRSKLIANSTCGSALQEEKVCPVFFTSRASVVASDDSSAASTYSKSECELCDARSVVEDRQHPIDHITKSQIGDYFNNELCWMSQPGETKPVMVEINFEKLMEALYIVLRFCNEPASDITIYKTDDSGSHWYPIHYITEDCITSKGIDPNGNVSGNKASCAPLQKQGTSLLGLYSAAQNHRNYNDPELQTRKLATGFRIVFQGYAENVPESYKDDAYKFYSLASMEIGGQCQCNGHANKCQMDGRRTRCDCQHNTAGIDCDSCHFFYQDLPWQPATRDRPFECKKCNCNGHSTECYFDQDVYERSGKVSGGMCYNCKHNTTGRFCHQCAEGSYRTPDTPISSPHACTPCDCHPSGSVSTRRCDPITGQCMCKPNVKGRNCGSCEKGYRISDRNDIPCIQNGNKVLPPDAVKKEKDFDYWEEKKKELPRTTTERFNSKNDDTGMVADVVPVSCKSILNKVLSFRTYCDYSVVVRVKIQRVDKTAQEYRFKSEVKHHLYSTNDGKRMADQIYISVPKNLIEDYKCIDMADEKEYYILAQNWKVNMQLGLSTFSLNAEDIVLKVKDSLERKMTKFRYRQLSKKCTQD